MKRVVLVPRWSGTEESDWYPWLRRHLQVEVVPLRPTPDAPEIAPCVAELMSRVDDPSETLLIGHSVGCQVILRTLAELGRPANGVLLVAGWWTVDAPWDSIRTWIETPLDTDRIVADRTHVLLSDDDPFTADYEKTRRLFEQRLGATTEVHPGAKHFNKAEEPAVLEAIRKRDLGTLD